MRRQATDWERIFQKTYLIKDYYSKYTKNWLYKYTKYTKIYKHLGLKKWAKDLNSHLTREDIQIANKHKKVLKTSCH